MFSGIKHVEEKIAHRKTLKECERCKLLYKKTEDNCPHCTHLPDSELQLLLSERKETRLSLGKLMFIGAMAIIILMFVFKS